MSRTRLQNYPRISSEGDKYFGFLDERQLETHHTSLTKAQMIDIIGESIEYANHKSSRAFLDIPLDADHTTYSRIYREGGQELFRYFHKYYGDPASTARECFNQTYKVIASRQFFNRMVQKGRMNSGWRYQFIAEKAANESGRFSAVSNIGTADADFSAAVNFTHQRKEAVAVYVSVKNRFNTLGGQDWPGAIINLENFARNDRNRRAPYLCIFGIAMDSGIRYIKNNSKTHAPYSVNTEVWGSDFFWPFFTGYTYSSIMKLVAEVLKDKGSREETDYSLPVEVTEAFGDKCKENGLVNENGYFNDIFKLVEFFCSKKVT